MWKNGSKVEAGVSSSKNYSSESSKTRDITGGLTKSCGAYSRLENQKILQLSQKSDGVVEFGADYKAKRRIRVLFRKTIVTLILLSIWFLKESLLAVQEGDFIRKGDMIIDGSPCTS